MDRRQVCAGLATAGFGRGLVTAPAILGAALATDRFVLHSNRVGRDFLIEVTPPAGPVAGRKAPVVYALDAGYHVAAAEAAALQAAGAMAATYLVAVGYPPGQPNTRQTDLLHRRHLDHGVSVGGGGAAFEAFILDELRPAIEARYPVDPSRSILLGHSLAGLFVANLLADRPRAFRAYLIASPSIWADGETLARVRAAAPKGQGRRVFLGIGGAETARMLRGADALETVRKLVFEGQVHRSHYPAFLDAALTDALPGPAAR
jgi:predicted alpha/beta superfamily hydrolase